MGTLCLGARFRKGCEARLDQFAYTATEDSLLAKEVSFGFFGKSGLQHAGAGATEALGVSERKRFRGTARILCDCQERGRSTAFGEDFANAMAGSFWSDHGDVDGGRRLDGAEADVEAVREHQCLARF